MASDNRLLQHRKQRYRVINFNTNEILAEGFTSQKAVKEWIKENRKENIHYSTVGYEETTSI